MAAEPIKGVMRARSSATLVGSLSLFLACPISASSPQDPGAQDPSASQRLLESKSLYSQGKEEVIVRDFFRDRTNGFFLDVGAAWPVASSNTYYLEDRLGWTGIAIDALPEYGPSWEKSRPRSRFYSYLVTDHADTLEPFYRADLTGVSSFSKQQARGPSGELGFEEMRVPSITLNSLLERNGVSRIDFLSMDIEGAELLALAGFDIDRFRPELVCIEAKPVNRKGLFDYFLAHGYERIEKYFEYDQTNYYFTPKQASAHDPYREPPPLPARWRPGLLAHSAVALAVAHVLPGMLLVVILGLGGSPLERWVFAAVLGGPLSGAMYWAALVSGRPSFYWAPIIIIDVAAVYLLLRDRRLDRPAASPQTKQVLALFLLLSVLGGAYMYTTGRLFDTDSQGSFVMDPAFTEDALFHAAVVEGLQTSYPAPLLSVSGARVYPYHVGYHMQVAAWERFFGVDRYDGIYRVGILWSLGLLVFAAYSFGLRFSKSPAVALGATALLFGGGLGFLFHAAPAANWWSLVFMDAALVSIFLVNPLLPALSLLFVGLACLDDYFEHARRGALLAACLSMIALVSVQELIAAQVLAAIVLGSVLARGSSAPRARRAALALALASAPVWLWSVIGFRDSNEHLSFRPLEIVRYSMETLGRTGWAEALAAVGGGTGGAGDLGLALVATVFWLVGFLGLRLVGTGGVVRDAISRSGSVRSGLAWFVLLGFPLTLLLRIVPADVTGLARQEAHNEAFWFATFGGVLLWLWTAEAVADIGRGTSRGTALAVSAAGLLAFPATLQHFVYKASLSAAALSVPPAAVGAARAGRALSSPQEVFVEPLKRVRPSVSAYLSGRPVVYESFVAYDVQWVPRRDLEYRHHAVALFWSSPDPGYGSWFLSRFGVRSNLYPQRRSFLSGGREVGDSGLRERRSHDLPRRGAAGGRSQRAGKPSAGNPRRAFLRRRMGPSGILAPLASTPAGIRRSLRSLERRPGTSH